MSALDDIKKALEAAESAYWAEVNRIAAQVREVHVKSFCHYHRARFVAGMGRWSFSGKAQEGHKEAGEWVESKAWSDWEPYDLPKPLRDILALPTIKPANDLGSLVDDYTPENYQVSPTQKV